MPSNIKDIVLFIILIIVGITITLYLLNSFSHEIHSFNNSTALKIIINSTIINKGG